MRVIALSVLLAAVALCAWRFAFPAKKPQDKGLAASQTYVFVDGSKPGETGEVAFQLANQGRRPITILKVEVGCALCIKATDLKGQILEPGQSCQLTAQIRIPDSGVDTQRLCISHDGERSPLTLTIEVAGRQRLPYLVDKSMKRAVFFELNSTTTVEKVRLTSCESVESEPWLGEMICDLPEATISRHIVREQRTGTLVMRVYEYRIGWRQLPKGLEVHGTLRVKTTYGTPSDMEVGAVAVTRPRSDRPR